MIAGREVEEAQRVDVNVYARAGAEGGREMGRTSTLVRRSTLEDVFLHLTVPFPIARWCASTARAAVSLSWT